jgi:hypothetical protein
MAKRIEGTIYDKKALDLVKKWLGFWIIDVKITDNGDGTFHIVAFDNKKELDTPQ